VTKGSTWPICGSRVVLSKCGLDSCIDPGFPYPDWILPYLVGVVMPRAVWPTPDHPLVLFMGDDLSLCLALDELMPARRGAR
jgi:hypothetical protein